jgi:hypothetical protein
LLAEEAKNGSDSPRSHASSTLLVLERSITPAMSSYDNLRELLDAINPSTQSDDDREAITQSDDDPEAITNMVEV